MLAYSREQLIALDTGQLRVSRQVRKTILATISGFPSDNAHRNSVDASLVK